MTNAKLIGMQIKKRREELKLSQEKLAELIHKTQRDISGYENSSRMMMADGLFELAEALQVPVGYFFADDLYRDEQLEILILEEIRLLKSEQSKQGALELLRIFRKYGQG